MVEKIKAMGLEVTGDEDFMEVSGDNAKLRELKEILDNEGYENDSSAMSLLFGIKPPIKSTDIRKIMVNHVSGKGYLLVA